MKPEEKAAIVTGTSFGVLAFVFAAIVSHPVALGAAAFSTYRMVKLAYDKNKKPVTKLNRDNLYL